MSDIAFSVIINNDGIDDIIFKTIMLKGEKGDKGDAGGAQIDDSTTASNTTWSSQKINSEISSMPDNLSEMGDVELDTITDGQMVGYDLASGKWKNKDADASSLKYDANTSIKDKIDEKADTASLSEVATSGDYDDLTNKPTIPPAQVNADWNASSGVAEILNKPTIPVVDTALDSSSGNAIANSAVADAIEPITQAITPQTIAITPNTSVATGFDYSVVKVGKIVTYFISCQLLATISATGTVIASGLPKAIKNTQIPVVALSGANAGQTNQMAITTDGNFQTRYSSPSVYPSGAYILSSGSYITSE